MSIWMIVASGAISLPFLVVHAVRLAPNARTKSLSAMSSSAIGEEKPPLIPRDHGLPANNPWPQTEVASKEPMRSASATSAGSASEITAPRPPRRSEEHTSELQSLRHLVCRLLL